MEDIIKKIEDYYEVVANFCDILREENKALNAYELKAVKKLYDRKAKAVNAYRGLVSFFIEHQKDLKELDERTKTDLMEVSYELDELIKDNEVLLRCRMETSKTVMNTIVNLAKMHNDANATAYGAKGGYYQPDNNRNAIAVNRTL